MSDVARHVRLFPLRSTGVAGSPLRQGGVAGGSAPAIRKRWHVDEHKAERLEDERDEEQEDGISAHRRGSTAAPSDKPEGTAPHPQDVNEIAEK